MRRLTFAEFGPSRSEGKAVVRHGGFAAGGRASSCTSKGTPETPGEASLASRSLAARVPAAKLEPIFEEGRCLSTSSGKKADAKTRYHTGERARDRVSRVVVPERR